MGGSQPSTTTQIQRTELPKWVEGASQENYAFAKQVANRPFQQYLGQEVAGLSPAEINAARFLNQGTAKAQGLYGNAQTALQRATGFQSSLVKTPNGFQAVQGPQGVDAIGRIGGVDDVSHQRFSGDDLKAYLNPYTGQVVDTTLSGMRDNLAISNQKADDAARGSGAWGSSRSGVMQAVLESQGAKDMAATEAGLRSQAYTDAAGRLQADNSSALQAALANQASGLTTQGHNLQRSQSNQSSALQTQAMRLQAQQGNQTARAQQAALGLQGQMANQSALQNAANLRMQAGMGLQGLGDSVANTAGKSALMSAQLGANARSIQQAKLDERESRFDARYQAPLDALNTRLAALGMSPYGKSQTTFEQRDGGESSSGLMTGLGAMASFLPFLFSDPDTKKNIKKIGPTGAPGIDAYEFEYKKSFLGRDSGKQVGVMADEVKKKLPGAVKKFKGPDGKTHDAVDYGKVARHIGKKRGFLAKAA